MLFLMTLSKLCARNRKIVMKGKKVMESSVLDTVFYRAEKTR
jgi:hypothetical protein